MVLLSNYPVYFVFDGQNDCHYTNTLLKLSPEAYLWHELRQQKKADLILFAAQPGDEIVIRTFDAGSARILTPQNAFGVLRSFFSSGSDAGEGDRVRPHCVGLAELEQKLRDPFAQWLRKYAAGHSGQKIAFVVSWEAFGALNGQGQLTALPDNCRLLIRMGTGPEALEKALLKDSTLADAFPRIAGSFQGSREPLLTVLKRQLGDQMICLDDQASDVRNMLVRQSFTGTEMPEPLQDLEDQAALLHICRQHRRLSLIDPDFRDDPGAAPTLDAIFRQPNAPQLRSALRRRAADFRQRHPGCTMEEALRAEGLVFSALPDAGVYQDQLANNVADLQLPADYPQRSSASSVLEQIKRDLRTLWNLPRNQMVLDMANKFCDAVRTAITEKDWDTLSSGLELMKFCGKQICISQDQNENMKKIFELGEDVLRQSAYLFGKKNAVYTDYDKFIFKAIGDQEQKELDVLKNCLRDDIRFFDKPEISAAEVQAHMQRSVERKHQELAKIEEDIRSAQAREAEARREEALKQKDAQIQQKYLVDEAPLPEEKRYDAEAGRISAERILKRNFIPL